MAILNICKTAGLKLKMFSELVMFSHTLFRCRLPLYRWYGPQGLAIGTFDDLGIDCIDRRP